jgi:hypothetical protein
MSHCTAVNYERRSTIRATIGSKSGGIPTFHVILIDNGEYTIQYRGYTHIKITGDRLNFLQAAGLRHCIGRQGAQYGSPV